ncbi:hypothetical protein SESBI_37282 [Sesbania bispinosa]|nr:hypothetical protein SESBI_37282 [Sesbania bispinosa]
MDLGGENKKAKREIGQILFLEMYGELVGIDLSGYGHGAGGAGGSISQLLSPVICCHLDLRNNGYPIGMRHAIIGDKHYLLGGAWLKGASKIGMEAESAEYSDKVYELDTNRCRTSIDIIQDPAHVLSEVNAHLKGPKFATVFNLKGDVYLLHSWWHRYIPFGGLASVSAAFERVLLNQEDNDNDNAAPFSCHEVSTPHYFSTARNRFSRYASAFYSHFVIDDKLVLLCIDNSVHIFRDGEWVTDYFGVEYNVDTRYTKNVGTHFGLVDWNFRKFTTRPPPTGLFLSEFSVPDVGGGCDSLGVLLSMDSYFHEEDDYGEDWAAIRIGKAEPKPNEFRLTYEIFAYAISKKTFQPNLTADDMYDPISYLFVSIFDVQLIESINPPPAGGLHEFLKVSPPIKKLAFRMDMGTKGFDSKPVLDAFLI